MVAELNHSYSLVSKKELPDGTEQECTQSWRRHRDTSRILIAVSLLLNVFFAGYMAYTSWWSHSPPSAWSILGGSPTYPVPFLQFSNYSSFHDEDDQKLSEIWENIRAEHGVLALDHTWAAEQGLPRGLSLPSDNQKGIYLIDAYHSIHCLALIRRSWYQLRDHNEESRHSAQWHYGHCFDYILQSIVCNPSDHIFSHAKELRTGDGEVRQCRDWRVLRDWATEHSACDPKDTKGENAEYLGLPQLCHGDDDFVLHRINTT